MNNYNYVKIFRNKFPRIFRILSFKIIQVFNLLIYFIFFPLKIYIETKIKIKLLTYKSLNKVIIRNDKLGDCILTLPFIYGSKGKKDNLFFISPILKEIISELNTNCGWQDCAFLKNKNNLIVANLSTTKIANLKIIYLKQITKLSLRNLVMNLSIRMVFLLIFSQIILKTNHKHFL